jgi:hypothetical protein
MMSVPAPGRAFVLLSAVLLVALAATAGAQAPPKDAGTGLAPADSATPARVLELTPAQRLAIYQSVTQTHKNNAAPVGFRATLGAHVPDSVELKPLSNTPRQARPGGARLQHRHGREGSDPGRSRHPPSGRRGHTGAGKRGALKEANGE